MEKTCKHHNKCNIMNIWKQVDIMSLINSYFWNVEILIIAWPEEYEYSHLHYILKNLKMWLIFLSFTLFSLSISRFLFFF